MKHQTSFVNLPTNLVPVLSVFSWSTALLMLLLAVYLVYSGNVLEQKNVRLHNQHQKLQAKLALYENKYVDDKNQLTLEQYEHLKLRVEKLNNLTEFFGQDVSLILSRLETLVPPGSFLVSLSYRSLSDELILVIESADVSDLTQFVDRLETAELFSDVAIVRQDNVKNKGRAAVQFEIHMKNSANEKG